MSEVLGALSYDNDPTRDTAYHVLVRLAAAMILSRRDAAPLVKTAGEDSWVPPNTVPSLACISSKIVNHVWKAVQLEFVKLYDKESLSRGWGVTIQTVSAVTVLGVAIEDRLSFAKQVQSTCERTKNHKELWQGIQSVGRIMGNAISALLTVYRGTYLGTVTYATGCWHMRANLHDVRSALLKTQRPALTLLTKAYHMTSTSALLVLDEVVVIDSYK
ncbi:hypothetical protein EVAR_78096_1 [Eumeta japonica]|uniref:Uncharacterized protein n=1 Tax=Eumeta variegata TaxID=151549 RepID=A0A4C1T1F1_EUMVA|nr:hypothetical protein EVAR_78096_1 [Eumeta japonica]